jgi:hypothetical protein
VKKLPAILLVLAVCFNPAAYHLMFRLKQTEIRKQIKMAIKAGVPDEELTVFRLTELNAVDFEWIHSREFRFRGMMYDVVREEAGADGERILHCVTDIQETRLFSRLDETARKTAGDHAAHTAASHMLMLLLHGMSISGRHQPVPPVPYTVCMNFPWINTYSQPGILIDAPPPRFAG